MATKNKMLSDFPEIAAEFDTAKNAPARVSDLTAGLAKKFWWKCPKGHSYESGVYSRTGRGQGCPYCSGRLAITGVNDLATLFPELAKEWSPRNEIRASQQLPFAAKKVWWIGTCGHEFDASVAGRTKSGTGCPYCSNHRALAGFNDLASLRPEVAAEWHPTKNTKTASEFTWGSNQRAWFQCSKGHEWQTAIRARTSNGSGCPFCAGNFVIAGETDLVTTHPEIAATWDTTKNTESPEAFSAGSTSKAWWKCEHGHSWQSGIYSRITKGCPTCAGRIILAGFNDLESQRPELLVNWDYETNQVLPSAVSSDSHHKYWWKCPKGHSYLAPVTAQKRGRGCSICSSKQVLPGFNDLESQHPELVAEWSDRNGSLRPVDVTSGGARKVWWVCPKGHNYLSAIGTRAKGVGCPICDNKRVLAGYNDLASQRPDLIIRWHPTRNDYGPEQLVVGSIKRVWWRCEEGHEWISTPANQAAGHGCPECGRFGYRGSLPGVFYFLDNPSRGAAKVGITNAATRNSRLEILSKFGFTPIKTWEHQDGHIIRNLETQTLRYIRRDLGLPPYLTKEDVGTAGGWRETFSRAAISQQELIDWVNRQLAELRQRQ